MQVAQETGSCRGEQAEIVEESWGKSPGGWHGEREAGVKGILNSGEHTALVSRPVGLRKCGSHAARSVREVS